MVEGLQVPASETWQTHRAFGRDEFGSTPEFAESRLGVKEFLQIPTSELDELEAKANADSLRAENPNAPGRKKNWGPEHSD